jgi:carboxyl-terminal processing protease
MFYIIKKLFVLAWNNFCDKDKILLLLIINQIHIMKTIFKYSIIFFFALSTFISCQDQDDIAVQGTYEIQNFIWKGLNLYYLWQANVPNLADSKFPNQTNLNTFLNEYPKPENLFESLLYKPKSLFSTLGAVDKFSWIVNDYLELEGQLQGNTNNSGVEFGLVYKSGSTTDIFGYVRYIIPGSDASSKNIKRGDIFYAVNGTSLTNTNYQGLLFGSNNDFTLNLADYNNSTITPNGMSVNLTKTNLAENPILISKVIVAGSHKIGYLMYNGFYADYDLQLNTAFGNLKSQGITDLVLDLRYNGGGSIQTSARLASMITGSFNGQVFAKQKWNDKIQSYFNSNNPESLNNYFSDKIGTTAINSLGLTRIYILTSKSSASASELVINGLKPYINVIQIGDITTGKNVGSVTLYDSPTFGKDKRNPNHRYAMQPIVLKIVNGAGFGDYQSGLVPTFTLKENYGNLGVLGNSTEPLLSLAIAKITGIGKYATIIPGIEFKYLNDSKSINGVQNQMYLEKAPEGLLKALE